MWGGVGAIFGSAVWSGGSLDCLERFSVFALFGSACVTLLCVSGPARIHPPNWPTRSAIRFLAATFHTSYSILCRGGLLTAQPFPLHSLSASSVRFRSSSHFTFHTPPLCVFTIALPLVAHRRSIAVCLRSPESIQASRQISDIGSSAAVSS